MGDDEIDGESWLGLVGIGMRSVCGAEKWDRVFWHLLAKIRSKRFIGWEIGLGMYLCSIGLQGRASSRVGR